MSQMMNMDSTFQYKTLFGPVPSRRLGISLGVDLVPHKTCSLDCVYCESGATTHLTLKRKEYVSVERIKDELRRYLSSNEKIDYVTFSGSGEPTLNEGIGEIIQFLKADYPAHKIALLTNSTLFDQPLVRRQVKDADVVMASLDAATKDRFKQINRPHPNLDLNRIVAGLTAFAKGFAGRLLLEYFIVKDGNDQLGDLQRIKTMFAQIDADGILLNTLDRPAPEAWVQPVETDRLQTISDFLENTEVVTYSTQQPVAMAQHGDLTERLVETIRRRPYTVLDVSQIMGVNVEALQPVLDRLVASKELAVKQMDRGIFYTAASAI